MSSEVVVVTEPGDTVVIEAPGDEDVEISGGDVSIVEVGISGPQGPPGEGIVGPQGPPGTPGEGTFVYTHDQAVPSDTWTIVHNLGGYPNVTVVDSAGTQVEGDVSYIDTNTIVVTFAAAFSGTAHLS